MSQQLINVKNLSVKFVSKEATVNAVNNVSFTIDEGETLGLVGETGAGKTTIAKAILQLIQIPPGKIDQGEIIYKGEDLLKKNNKQMKNIRGSEISMIFQDPMTALDPVMKVSDQIAEGLRAHNKKLSRAEALIQALDMLEMVGIPASRGSEYPNQFSGGMKQRVVIAMALACSPHLLIADEPTTALDVTIQAQVLKMIKDLKEKNNTAMLLITHDLGIVAEVCDRVGVVYAGEIVEYGTLERIFHNVKHPYTIGLFGSLPSLDKKVTRLTPIKGLMPDPTRLPKGCYFCDRCPHATEACSQAHPELKEVEPGHFVRCFMEEGGTEK